MPAATPLATLAAGALAPGRTDMTFHRTWLPAWLAAACLLLQPAQAATLVVDDFVQPDGSTTTRVMAGSGQTLFEQFDPGVLGGVRNVFFNTYDNPLPSVSAVASGQGMLSMAAGVGARVEVLALYGAFSRVNLDPTLGGPLLGLDLRPYNAFEMVFAGANTLNLNVVLYTSNPQAGQYYSTVGVNSAAAGPDAPLTVTLPFAQDPSFNFAQVDGMALIINRANPAPGNSFTLDRFSLVSSVPEPGTWLLALAGVAVLGARRVRAQQAQSGPAGH
jgi:hypothetical protein